jgi:hypothetical protein
VIESEAAVTVFAASNGDYYTEWEVERRLRSGPWRRCLQQVDPDRRLVAVEDGCLLSLVTVAPTELPSGVELRVDGECARVVERRRPLPR